jgi:amidase
MAFNVTGWPAVVVRGGTAPDGMPIGVQVVAKPWREDQAIAVAAIIEKKLGGWQAPANL